MKLRDLHGIALENKFQSPFWCCLQDKSDMARRRESDEMRLQKVGQPARAGESFLDIAACFAITEGEASRPVAKFKQSGSSELLPEVATPKLQQKGKTD